MTRIRCAIYTRKSSEEGLDQAFNSLDAQREACAAYIHSQKHEGWQVIPTKYDDGGVSGGTLNRPALQALFEGIDSGRIDMIVVYKIDRLTRSLTDFSKLVDRLDGAGASFVSVTQQFNTSTSMGRLTLNVLLSFAQFEREVTAERIRDKIAASKKKGMWMGGPVPLGYDKAADGLVANFEETKTVQSLFQAYTKLGCVRELKSYADQQGLRTKAHRFRSGSRRGGVSFSRGRLYHLLSNPVYIGRIRHKEETYDGLHDAIIDNALWDQVQCKIGQNRRERASQTNAAHPSPLAGKVFDGEGKALMTSHANKKGRRYRYYISKHHATDSGSRKDGWRLSAQELEAAVVLASTNDLDVSLALAEADKSQLSEIEVLSLIDRVELSSKALNISLTFNVGAEAQRFQVTAPFELRRRGVEKKLVLKTGHLRDPDMVLVRRIDRATNWAAQIKAGSSIQDIAKSEDVSPEFLSNNLKFAFLAPSILQAIIEGCQRPDITAKHLFRVRIPMDWLEQEHLFL